MLGSLFGELAACGLFGVHEATPQDPVDSHARCPPHRPPVVCSNKRRANVFSKSDTSTKTAHFAHLPFDEMVKSLVLHSPRLSTVGWSSTGSSTRALLHSAGWPYRPAMPYTGRNAAHGRRHGGGLNVPKPLKTLKKDAIPGPPKGCPIIAHYRG